MSSGAPRIDLRPDHLEIVRDVLRRHLPTRQVVAFGSRATWTAKEYSDLDLAVLGDEPLPLDTMAALSEGFSESDLPFKVDVVVWANVDDRLRNVIRRDVVEVQARNDPQWPISARADRAPSPARTRAAEGDWAEMNLGGVCTKIGSGATPRGGKAVYLRNGPFALIRSQNVFNDGFRDQGLAYVGEVHAAQLKNVQVAEGDVLVNVTGDSVARVCQVPLDVLPARVNQHVAIVRPDPSLLSSRFLRYALVSPPMQARLLSWAQSGGTRNALTKGMLESLTVLAPRDTGMQRAIADILGTLDDKIELNRRMNETLEAMARALFKSWFVDFDPVRAKMEAHDTGLPPSTAALFPDQLASDGIPFGWQMSTVGEHVLNFDSRRIPVSSARRADMQGRFPYHGAAGVLDRVNDYLFDGIFLLLGEDGSVVRESGLAVTQYVSGQFWVNNHAHVLQGKGAVSTEQAYLHFSFEPIAPFVTGAVQPKLSQRRMNQVPFVYAGEAVCRAFAQAVGGMFARLRRNAMESSTLAALRDLLLPKLLSGEIRVPDVERTIEVIA